MVIILSAPVIQDPTPLQCNYVPPKFVDRDRAQSVLQNVFSEIPTGRTPTLTVQGPHGTGKTHLVLKYLHNLPDTVNTCHLSCRRYNTQYKVLSELYQTLFGEEIEDGYHTATLKQNIKDRLTQQTVIVLDDMDFLLFNNGDNLLYYLSRELPPETTLILITATTTDLESRLEERTYSSLQPQQLLLDHYTSDELFEILAARVQTALTADSLQRQALQYISTMISNPRIGLHWIQTAAETGGDAITEPLVQRVRSQAYQQYVDAQLEDFTVHHRLTYQAVQELTIAQEPRVRTGQIYDRYYRLCERIEEQALSQRRVSDFLKHLELLDLISVDYHYGGEHGRTREIRLKELSPSEGE